MKTRTWQRTPRGQCLERKMARDGNLPVKGRWSGEVILQTEDRKVCETGRREVIQTKDKMVCEMADESFGDVIRFAEDYRDKHGDIDWLSPADRKNLGSLSQNPLNFFFCFLECLRPLGTNSAINVYL